MDYLLSHRGVGDFRASVEAEEDPEEGRTVRDVDPSEAVDVQEWELQDTVSKGWLKTI